MIAVFLSFVVLVIIFILILNCQYKKTNHFRNQFFDVLKFWNNNTAIPSNLKIINLGSTQPKYALDYNGLGVNACNCAVAPQTFEYDFKILKSITPKLDENAIVIIPICLFKFFLFRQEERITHLKYYTFLNHKEIINNSIHERIFSIDFPLLRHPSFIKHILHDIPMSNPFSQECQYMTQEQLEQDALSWIKGWEKQFNISLTDIKLSKKNVSDIEYNIIILNDIIDYCLLHNFKPIIVILPVTKFLSSFFSDSFLENYIYSPIKKAIRNNNVVFSDFLKDKRFTSEDLFFNSFFFNTKGRKAFTYFFIQHLKENGIL